MPRSRRIPSFEIDGKLFGIQTGYNFQVGRWVWGIEADAQLTAQHADPKFPCPVGVCNPAGPVLAALDQSQKLEWFGTLRARFGATITPNAFVYVTGGAAVADCARPARCSGSMSPERRSPIPSAI